MSDRQCPSCGGFCKKSGCERANVEPELTPAELHAGIALQLREIERLRMQLDQQREYHAAELADVVAEREHLALDLHTERAAVVALRAEIDALREDAVRYRWLREQPIDGAPGMPVVAMPNGMKSGYYLNYETADYAIDAARKATP